MTQPAPARTSKAARPSRMRPANWGRLKSNKTPTPPQWSRAPYFVLASPSPKPAPSDRGCSLIPCGGRGGPRRPAVRADKKSINSTNFLSTNRAVSSSGAFASRRCGECTLELHHTDQEGKKSHRCSGSTSRGPPPIPPGGTNVESYRGAMVPSSSSSARFRPDGPVLLQFPPLPRIGTTGPNPARSSLSRSIRFMKRYLGPQIRDLGLAFLPGAALMGFAV